jgi:hypothetical protein
MPAILCAVSGLVHLPNGVLAANITLRFARQTFASHGATGMVVPAHAIMATTDGAGALSLSLMSGNWVLYYVDQHGAVWSCPFPVPAVAAADVQAIIDANGYIAETAPEIIAAVTMMRDQVEVDANLARDWASKPTGFVAGSLYSAYYYATQAAASAASLGSGIISAIAALTTTGLVVRTGTGTVVTRTITAGAGVSVINGDGVGGPPTVALDLVTTNTRLVGGFGAASGGSVADDWNAPENARNGMGAKLLPGNAINGPNGTGHLYHSLCFEYSVINYLTQFAIPYNASASDSFVGTIYYRSNQGAWGTWRALASDANILSLLTYASQPEAEAGSATDKPMNALRVRDAIKAAVAPVGTAPMFAARAWVQFDGKVTATIRGSGNVSSVARNGVGDYTVNFITAMPDANFAAVANYTEGNTATGGMNDGQAVAFAHGTASVRVFVTDGGGSARDAHTVSLVIFR